MATLYAQSTGNWSAINWNTAANGSGSNQTPASADTLVSNSYTVTVDGNYTVTQVTNTSGGTFSLGNGCTLTATHATAGALGATASVGAVTCSLTTGQSATFAGHMLAGSTANQYAVSVNGAGGSLSLVGNCTAAAAGTAVYISDAATVTITGNLTGGSSSGGHGVTVSAAANLSITGTATGGSSISGYGLNITGAATITLNGPAVGATGPGINCSGAAVISTSVVSGSAATGGGASTSSGINITNVGAVLTCTGTLTPSGAAPAILSTVANTNLLSGPFLANASGQQAVWAPSWRWKASPSSTYMEVYTHDLSVKRNLYTADAVGGNPAVTNVRSGTAYGPVNELTGTLAVPAAGAVACGVAVDHTVGTAVLRQQDVAAAVGPIWAAG